MIDEIFVIGDRVILIDDDGFNDDITIVKHHPYVVTDAMTVPQKVLGENGVTYVKIRNIITIDGDTKKWFDRERFISLNTYTVNNRKKKIENLKLKI